MSMTEILDELPRLSDNERQAILHRLMELNTSLEIDSVADGEPLPPKEALWYLQQDARVSPAQAESYLNEVRAERLAASQRGEA